MRSLCVLLVGCLALPLPPAAFGQEPAHKLNLVIIEGDGAINNIRQRTAREPIVQVEDENHRPVAGAAILFTLPDRGAGGTFADGSHTLRTVSDAQGRATARGIRINNNQGQFQISVQASFNGMTAATTITQTTAAATAGAGAAAGAAAGISGKLIAIVAIAAAAAAGGAYAATHSGGGSSSTPATSITTITAGTGVVGPPK